MKEEKREGQRRRTERDRDDYKQTKLLLPFLHSSYFVRIDSPFHYFFFSPSFAATNKIESKGDKAIYTYRKAERRDEKVRWNSRKTLQEM